MTESISLTGVTEFNSVTAGCAKKLLLLAHMKAPTVEAQEDAIRAPVRVSAVIDVSGSMRGDKLRLVKETLLFVIAELTPADELGVVTFHTAVNEVFPVLPMTSENKERAAAVVNRIVTQGCTNLSGGLLAGLSQITKETPAKKTVSSVWLFTDGIANAGLTSTSDIVNAMLPALNTEVAPTVFTYGFGNNHSEDMLRAVAEAGQGMYYYISSPDTIPSAFAESLGGLMSVVGQNVHLTVKAAEGVRILSLLTKQQQQSVAEDVATMKLKDFFAEEERDIVLEVELPPAKEVGRQGVCTLQLAYTDNAGRQCCVEAEGEVERVAEEVDEESALNEDVDAHRNRILVVDAMEEARKLADLGSLEKAAEELKATVARVKTSKSCEQRLCKDLVEDASVCLEGLQRKKDYSMYGRKRMAQMNSCHQWQKACGAPKNRYANKCSVSMVDKMEQQMTPGPSPQGVPVAWQHSVLQQPHQQQQLSPQPLETSLPRQMPPDEDRELFARLMAAPGGSKSRRMSYPSSSSSSSRPDQP